MANKEQTLRVLGKNIKSLREKSGLTQDNLAEKVNMTREHIAKVETAAKTPSLDLVINLAEVFEVSVKELFE